MALALVAGCSSGSAEDSDGSSEGSSDPGTLGTSAVDETATTTPDPTTASTSSSSDAGTDTSGGSESESTGACEDCPPYETWPTSAEEALSRSTFWDPDAQVAHQGTFTSTASGELIENLHIVDGELVIGHDDVVVRNVTVEGLDNEDGGNVPVTIIDAAQNVELEGILMGPPDHDWDDQCNMPMFPTSGFISNSDASWTMRACATRHVGDAIKAQAGTGAFEDCFLEIAMGIWAVGSCENDHTDTVQISSGDPSLTFRRVWMDALRYVVDSPDGPITQPESPGGATTMQLGSETNGAALVYDTVRLRSGNYSLRIFGVATLSIVNSVALDYVYEPLLTGDQTDLTIVEWSGNTLGDGSSWDPPEG